MSELSLRLKTIASLVPIGARVCDVGTDHARLPIYLKQNNIANSVIATDLNEKPLKFAKENIEKSGVSGISLRLCDGLSAVENGEADTVIVAGIGGEVISEILENCCWIKSNSVTLILQPTTSPEVLRKTLIQSGFDILTEIPLFENGKIYSIMTARFCGNTLNYPEHFYYIGKVPKNENGIIYIKKQQKRIFDCISAYKNIPAKQKEYELLRKIYLEIEKILTENT
ncbi:MAG: SAM-dependent methyltransferase [Clostridia bacterium]|nr:SAM-dependent methyltransferase [Clostridia bacterium]